MQEVENVKRGSYFGLLVIILFLRACTRSLASPKHIFALLVFIWLVHPLQIDLRVNLRLSFFQDQAGAKCDAIMFFCFFLVPLQPLNAFIPNVA